jgi:hypothetical protein
MLNKMKREATTRLASKTPNYEEPFDGGFSNVWEDEDSYGYDYSSYLLAVKHPLDSVKDLEKTLRIQGLKFRKQLQSDLKENSQNWEALRRPASLHSARSANARRDVDQHSSL